MVGQSLSWRVIPRHLIPQVIQRCWLSSMNRIVFRMSHLIAIVSEEIKVFPSAIDESFRLIVKKVSVTHVQHALVMQDTCAGVLPNTHFHLGYECGKINLCIYMICPVHKWSFSWQSSVCWRPSQLRIHSMSEYMEPRFQLGNHDELLTMQESWSRVSPQHRIRIGSWFSGSDWFSHWHFR